MGAKTQRLAVAVGAVIGVSACSVSVLASYWAMSGRTPPALYSEFESLRGFRSALWVAGVPLEYLPLLWFTAIAVASLSGAIAQAVVARLVVLSSIILAGALGGFAVAYDLRVWPLNVSAMGALISFLALAQPAEQPAVRVSARWSRTAGALMLLSVLLAAGGGVALRSVGQRDPREAAQKNFISWFDAQPRPSSVDLGDAQTISVVVYTDYQCPISAMAIPKTLEFMEEIRQSGVQVSLEVRHFPLDAACNPNYWGSLHPAACEAAAAKRFIEVASEDTVGDFEAWLYAHNITLTRETIQEELAAKGFGMAYSEARRAILINITEEVRRASQLGVRVTPTFFVNGVRLPRITYLQTAVRHEVSKRSGAAFNRADSPITEEDD